ncbi:MAG: hypothetical protein E7291_03005 [Lachnospiraceae bacterium]|nr:hypothetical protein [Lachnospiraceae bacterium]
MKVIGIQKNVSFKIDGNDFNGVNLFVSQERPGVEGVATDKVYVDSRKDCYATATAVKLGDNVTFGYNRYGKVDMIYINK